MIVFVDTSALGSVYLGDEADGRWIGDVIFNGPDPVVICEIADVEMASLLAQARRDGRIDDSGVTERVDAYNDHTAVDGPIGVLPLNHDTLARAQQFALRVQVRTLDALHLAAAQILAEASDDEISILTRDIRQASAAEDLGLTLFTQPQ